MEILLFWIPNLPLNSLGRTVESGSTQSRSLKLKTVQSEGEPVWKFEWFGRRARWGLGPSELGLFVPHALGLAHSWERAFPGARCGTCGRAGGPGVPRDQPRDLRQTCLDTSSASRTLPRSNSGRCCSPSASTTRTKHSQSCACARRRLQAQPGLVVTGPTICPAQEDAGKMPRRGHRPVVTSLAGTGFTSRREAGWRGL